MEGGDLAAFAPPGDAEASSFVQVGEVALDADEAPVGYAFASLVAGQAELLILGVHPGARRQGLARRLLEALFERLRGLGAESVFLEVRRGNAFAIKLYEVLGFASNGVRVGYYADNGEDALLFRKELSK